MAEVPASAFESDHRRNRGNEKGGRCPARASHDAGVAKQSGPRSSRPKLNSSTKAVGKAGGFESRGIQNENGLVLCNVAILRLPIRLRAPRH